MTGCHISQTRSGRTPHAKINLDALIIDWYFGDACASELEGSSCAEIAGILDPNCIAAIEQQDAQGVESLLRTVENRYVS